MSVKDILCTYIYKTNYKIYTPATLFLKQIVIVGTIGGGIFLNYNQ